MSDPDARSSPPAAGRLYSDEEVALILRRALEPRAAQLASAGPDDGVTLRQLESIATEAGIDLARIREAAASLEAVPAAAKGTILFGPRANYVFDREVEGELPPENHAAVVAAARRLTHSRGNVQEVGDWLEWQSDARIIHVTVKPEDGRTSVQVMADGGFQVLGIWGITGMATLITVVGIGAETAGISVLEILGIVTGGFTFARTAWEIAGRRARAKYTALAERLTHEISTLTRRGGSDRPTPEEPTALAPSPQDQPT